MAPTHASTSAEKLVGLFLGPEGACGRLMISWTTAGGIAGGGILVGLLTLAGYVSPGLQLLAAPVLFLLGAVLGALHGAVLAVAGRPDSFTRGRAARCGLLALLVAVPALAPAWVVTAAISLTAALVREWRPVWGLLSAGGWVFGIVGCLWAAREGWNSVRRAWARWDESALGTVLTCVILVLACVVLVRARPGIWGTDLRLNPVGAVALAVALTLWVGLPLVWTVLHVAHGWMGPGRGREIRT